MIGWETIRDGPELKLGEATVHGGYVCGMFKTMLNVIGVDEGGFKTSLAKKLR